MFKNINIENFKTLEKIECKELNYINLFAGDNNTGKTSLLEAIFLLELAYLILMKY